MKYIVHVDTDNYVVGLELSNDAKAIEVNEEIANSQYQTCYKFINNTFVFDNEKKARLDTEEINRQRIEELKRYLDSTDYIYNSIREGGRTEEYYADVIEKRKQARKEIQELEGK